nr:MAG TPA: hypothetical protein [Caudoviricetes sp.]
MEIDFRTAREAMIYEIGIQTGRIQQEKEQQSKRGTQAVNSNSQVFIKHLQSFVDSNIEIIKGL